MAGMGILLAGLSGAGKGLASSIEQDRRVADDERLMRERARLEEEKMLRIEEARRVATRKAGIAQGQEISAEAGRLQSARDQADADRINTAYGSSMTAADAAGLRDAPEEARKIYGILGASRQSQLEDRATAAENLGYLDAARETRGILQAEIQNQRYEQESTDRNRRMDQEVQYRREQTGLANKREDRLAGLQAAELSFRKSRAAAEDARAANMDAREQRQATAKALDGANDFIKSLQKERSDPLLDDNQKKMIDEQITETREEAKRLRTLLSGVGIDGGKGGGGKTLDINKYLIGSPGNAGDNKPRTVPNPVAPSPAPAPRQSSREMAASTLDRAIDQTVRELTAASNRGDKENVDRLNRQLLEQQAAKRKAVD